MHLLNPHADQIFYHDVPSSLWQPLMDSLMYQSRASLVTPAEFTAAELQIPKTYVVCTEDRCIHPIGQRAMAGAMGAKVIEFACGHSPQIKEDESKQLVKLIVEMAA
jgi:hypothetical protein